MDVNVRLKRKSKALEEAGHVRRERDGSWDTQHWNELIYGIKSESNGGSANAKDAQAADVTFLESS